MIKRGKDYNFHWVSHVNFSYYVIFNVCFTLKRLAMCFLMLIMSLTRISIGYFFLKLTRYMTQSKFEFLHVAEQQLSMTEYLLLFLSTLFFTYGLCIYF